MQTLIIRIQFNHDILLLDNSMLTHPEFKMFPVHVMDFLKQIHMKTSIKLIRPC